jgi:hypothetical protein
LHDGSSSWIVPSLRCKFQAWIPEGAQPQRSAAALCGCALQLRDKPDLIEEGKLKIS